ncbi:MAG: AAA family ATPase [Verrucomicrobiales bacterium]|nr:AAA family ATPase [Verrucomicrobiales bacterium]
MVTLPAVLAREREIIQAARDGISIFCPILPAAPKLPEALSAEQRTAFVRLLTTRDFVTLFRGGAGTGKSFVLRQLEDGLRAGGREVVMLAPQRQQVADMAKAGFQSPTTVSEFLARGSVPRQAVIVVDEAGQLGGKQMQALVRLAKEAGGRLILSGDTRQHGPVEASDALLALERYAELKPAPPIGDDSATGQSSGAPGGRSVADSAIPGGGESGGRRKNGGILPAVGPARCNHRMSVGRTTGKAGRRIPSLGGAGEDFAGGGTNLVGGCERQ